MIIFDLLTYQRAEKYNFKLIGKASLKIVNITRETKLCIELLI